VSTVDSGNLLGCLIALKQGLREKLEEPWPGPAIQQGLADTLGVVQEKLDRLLPSPGSTTVAALQALRKDADHFARLLGEAPDDLAGWQRWLDELDGLAAGMPGRLEKLGDATGEGAGHLGRWVTALVRQVRDHKSDLEVLAPWLKVLPTTAGERPGNKAQKHNDLRRRLLAPVSIAARQADRESVLAALAELEHDGPAGALQEVAREVAQAPVAELQQRIHRLADRASELAEAMDFTLLYNEHRNLFSIGYNLHLGRLDAAHYDLLASEAALTSFLAVARGDVPRKHWFQLGRPLTWISGGLGLLSWGGTMFEYLMPRLLLRPLPGTLLDASMRTAVARQIEYGRQRHIPWGISESGYSLLDAALDYQYQSFGVPGLGLKRGLGRDLVIAPYATGLAAMVTPAQAAENFRRLSREHAEGPFGYYEAVDYTSGRVSTAQRAVVVRSGMAHHQGMMLVALTNCLLGDVMVRRFHLEPMVRATELLLQERVPVSPELYQADSDDRATPIPTGTSQPVSRRLTTARTVRPRTHLLSNGRYTVLLTNAGAGFSTCDDLAVTRWREDATRDSWGNFCYVRDLRSGLVWSAGHQPICRVPDSYEVVYSVDRAEFRRLDAGIETLLEVTVSPEHNAELRRITLTNHNKQPHELELTSYVEIVLAAQAADLAHPAFGKLFLQTEFLPASHAILCWRRTRAATEKPVWGVHVLAVEGPAEPARVQFETDRLAFLGRGRDPSRPAALGPGAVLGGATGPVLDPVFSLRCRARLEGGTSLSLAFTTAVADSREEAVALADAYHDYHTVVHDFELAWARCRVELQHLRLTTEEAHLYQRLGAYLIYTGPQFRPPVPVRALNTQGQQGLWRYGISGDRPILLVRLRETAELGLVRELVAAHSYLTQDGLSFDLVMLDEQQGGYFRDVHDRLMQLVRASNAEPLLGKPGGLFVLRAEQLPAEDRALFASIARVVLEGQQSSLADVLDQVERSAPPALPENLPRQAALRGRVPATAPELPADLLFGNGFGGFTPDGREYVMVVHRDGRTPVPWINVVANENIGFLVSESGSGYTWAGNSQTNRLTPWSNDPVSDPPGEVLYLRDESSGEFWQVPAALAGGEVSAWLCRHGQGYTVFEQITNGLSQELLLVVPTQAPVKLLRLRVRNLGDGPRRLSATFYVEWVLGVLRTFAPVQVWCEVDEKTGAILAHNPFNPDFGASVAFVDVDCRPRGFTTDRMEFLGRNGHPASPAALGRVRLSGRSDGASDPCAAVQAPFDIGPGEQAEVLFLVGEAASVSQVHELIGEYRQPGAAQRVLEEVRRQWDGLLDVVQVQTPDRALDLLLNRWLLYQALSCRVWGRSAFYQSGGAYGFRDQLQDLMALAMAAPQLTREHLLRSARHQFVEGDVLHWWHPPAGRGVRTRISDDYLWLPLATSHYLDVTGDTGVLQEKVPFLEAPPLAPDQEEVYGQPAVGAQTGTLYEHCIRAVDHGLRFGAHGLPLMGTGDWNDGMNRVGNEGKGETVWGGWFLLTILDRWAPLAEQHGDGERSSRYRAEADRLIRALEENAWDGEWYRRAYFDNGTQLGSAQNTECRIDSLPQAWAAISGRVDHQRARQALASVDRLLVRRAERLVLLFTPPFDRGELHPGYIRGYVPGIRENGGQYTHGSTWVVRGAAQLRMGDWAVELLGLLNPVYHAQTTEQARHYKVEPYVVAADIYSHPPHIGRGGWTWYTGSAGWLYRVAVEDVLGLRVHGNRLELKPCVARGWKSYTIVYRYGKAEYHISVDNPDGAESGVRSCLLDGQEQDAVDIPLVDDGARHEVRVVLGLTSQEGG
jgi:cyclic beta-1,2-glucan synthetase